MFPHSKTSERPVSLGTRILVLGVLGFCFLAPGRTAGQPPLPGDTVHPEETHPATDSEHPPPADAPRLEEGNETAPKTLAGATTTNKDVRLVNSKHIRLNFEFKDVGPSGVSLVELWYTRDGKDWRKGSEINNAKSPITFRVADEGLYGFTLIVRSGAGLGKLPPKTGDAPQLWIEVDQTPPTLEMLAPVVGRNREITFGWKASDKNLDAKPISFYYAEKLEGPWKPIAEHLENSGRLVWRMPEGMPFRFFLRAQAIDRAGNLTVSQTQDPVTIDPSEPVANILGVEALPDKPR